MKKKEKEKMSVTPLVVKQAEARKVKKPGFVASLKSEVKKVSWPTKSELATSTKIVLWSVFSLGFGVYGIDLLLNSIIRALVSMTRLITG